MIENKIRYLEQNLGVLKETIRSINQGEESEEEEKTLEAEVGQGDQTNQILKKSIRRSV